MSSRLSAEICRINAAEKLSDRLLLSGLIGASERKSLSDQLVIGYLFEITRPWLPSSQVLPAMVTVLEEQLSHLNTKDNLDDQFEGVLRAVNLRLNEVSEGGETDWIGNLNGLIVLLGKEELHFSQTGRCPAYLLQNNRIRQITDDQSEKDPHPLKTFSNLASGHLQVGDSLLVANVELYNEISLDALRRILNTNSPFAASTAIARELKKEKNNKVCSIITSIHSSDEVLKEEPQVIEMEEILQSNAKKAYKKMLPFLQAAKKGSEQLGKASAKAAHEIGSASVKAAQQASITTKEKVIPGAAALLAKSSQKLKETTQASTHRPVVEIILPSDQREAVATGDQLIGEVIPASKFDLEPAPGTPVTLQQKAIFFITKKIPYLIIHGLSTFSSWIAIPKNKKITALVIAVILVGSTIWGAMAGRNQPTSPVNATGNAAILAAIQENESKATSAINLEQAIEASKLLDDSFNKLATLSELSDAQKNQADTLWLALTKQADTLTKTTRFDTTTASYNFPGNVTSFFTGLPYFYGYQNNGNGILRTGSGSLSQIQTTVSLPDTTQAIASITSSSESDTSGYILTKQSKVYRVAQIGDSTKLLSVSPQSGDFASGTVISSYSGNVYILDGGSGLLWKYVNSGTSYSKGTMIIDVNKVNLKGGISVSIDGSIYILKQDGSVTKLTAAKADPNFTLQNIPYLSQKLIRPLQIISQDGSNSFFVLDGGTTSSSYSNAKIMEFDKSGNFIRQYAFPKTFTDVRGFDINQKNKKLWILNGNAVSEFTLL